MAVGLGPLPALPPVVGVRLGTTSAGIKKAGSGRRDLVLIELEEGTACAAVFTRNAFCAAPVVLARRHLDAQQPRYLLINTGNANAGTGRSGLDAAARCCTALAELTGAATEAVLPFSTGVIGEPLPTERLVAALPQAVDALRPDGWAEAASGIMTTDTAPKGASRTLSLDGRAITVTGIAKGAGMIRPDMATMLAFIATDALVAQPLLQSCLVHAVNASFNRITVDGDTSTNDACILLATGQAGGTPIDSNADPRLVHLQRAITEVCVDLAQSIVRDGEGATKFISVVVEGGGDEAECLAVAYTIAHSPLVKTAFFASDPNWGRVLACVGRAHVEGLDLEAVSIHLDEVCIVRGGGRAPDYQEAEGARVMAREDITVRVDLARGAARSTVWTCDFSYDYVRINAEYRT